MQKDVVKMLLVNDEYQARFGPGAADPAEPFTQDEIKAINYITGAGPFEECFKTCGRINDAISTALNIGFMAGYKHAQAQEGERCQKKEI